MARNIDEYYNKVLDVLINSLDKDKVPTDWFKKVIVPKVLSASYVTAIHKLTASVSGKTLIPDMGFGELYFATNDDDIVDAYFIDEWLKYSSIHENLVVSFYESKLSSRSYDGLDKFNSRDVRAESFSDASIEQKYDKILLYVKLNSLEDQIAYIDKCLDLLEENGMFVVITSLLILQDASASVLRKKILQNFSLEFVYQNSNIDTLGKDSLLLIRKRTQTPGICLEFLKPLDVACDAFLNNSGEHWLNAKSFFDRFDVFDFFPQYQEIRKICQDPNVTRLGDYAEVITADKLFQPTTEKNDNPVILDIHLLENGKLYQCLDNGYLYSTGCYPQDMFNIGEENHCFIQKDDFILLQVFNKTRWAFVDKDVKNISVDSPTIIIRAKDEHKRNLLRFFFENSCCRTLCKDYFIIQIEYNFNGFYPISERNVLNFAMPSEELLTSLMEHSETSTKKQIENLFVMNGWDVENNVCFRDLRNTSITNMQEFIKFEYDNFEECAYVDFVLMEKGKVKACVLADNVNADTINDDVLNGWDKIQKLSNAKLYLFIDQQLSEYKNRKTYLLDRIPAPKGYNVAHEADNTFLLQVMRDNFERLHQSTKRIEDKLDGMMNQINGCQTVISKQLESIENKQLEAGELFQKQEELYQNLSDAVMEKVSLKVNKHSNDFDLVQDELRKNFGDVWNRLETTTQTFLASAKMMYQQTSPYGDDLDYSGVCIPATKALEVELVKRFLIGFKQYLQNKFPRDGMKYYANYPYNLKKSNRGQIVVATELTLGSVPYLLCYTDKYDNRSDFDLQKDENILYDYLSQCLITKQIGKKELLENIIAIAEHIKEITRKYRNPAAHTGGLKKKTAEECLNCITEIESVLIKLLKLLDKDPIGLPIKS
ncbi:MAG: hypothetical protein MJY93_01510 [Fibrobacter sp.]|nr:hypothetical protein [Fibrobacter sp.]